MPLAYARGFNHFGLFSPFVEASSIADETWLTPYTVRISRRARRVSLVVALTEGVQVVVPAQFDLRRVPEVVRAKLAWFERALRRLQARRASGTTTPLPIALPGEIPLPALGETWRVSYRPYPAAAGVTLRVAATGRLELSGRTQDVELCRVALKRWLSRRARSMLGEWLAELSSATGLSYQQMSVRGQRSRWGSCSTRGTISLNYKLLFLPRPLVHYVLLHELCHTRQSNHAVAFWALVAQQEPDYRRLRAELRRAGPCVPEWAQ